ncbi:MAG: IS3 family transposase [Patescibacteria group bacterium]|nr:IS3 family transposase [Patescibacteria group bacterium]
MPGRSYRSLTKTISSSASKDRQSFLGLSRSSLYYQKREIDPLTLKLLNRIDEIFTKCPFYGSRKIKAQLKREGFKVNRKRVKRLMGILGIEAIYPKPNLSLNEKAHPVFPYLLKGLEITRPNQVWGIDITYIRLNGGFVYLVAVMDWYSRFVVAWDVSLSLDTQFVLDCLNKAFLVGIPEIINSDQGVQFTSEEYINLVIGKGIQISMDHRGRCFDNIFTERLWRNVKYEEVYLKEYASPKEAIKNLNEYFDFYDYDRPHQSLGDQTPAEVYFGKITKWEEVTKKDLKFSVLVS